MGVSQPGRNLSYIFLGFSINFASMLASSGDALFTMPSYGLWREHKLRAPVQILGGMKPAPFFASLQNCCNRSLRQADPENYSIKL
jgi:hypothetical protein